MHHSSLSLGSLSRRSDQPGWLRCEGRVWSAHQAVQRVAALSCALSRLLQLQPGDRIALLGASTDRFIEALFACMDAGAVVVPLNTRWSTADVADALARCEPRAIIVDAQLLHLITPGQLQPAPLILLGTDTRTSTGSNGAQARAGSSASSSGKAADSTAAACRYGSWATERLISEGLAHFQQSTQLSPAAPPTSPPVTGRPAPQPLLQQYHGPNLQMLSPPDGAALICFTSGTTGRPKGVVLSHSNFHAQSLAKLACVGYNRHDVYMHLAPLFHIGGLSSLMAVTMAGGRHVVMRKFDPGEALALTALHGVTSFIAVPTMVQDMAAAAAATAAAAGAGAASPSDGGGGVRGGSAAGQGEVQHRLGQGGGQWPSVQRVLVGAGGTSANMQAALIRMFPNAQLHTAYGMTEACSSITFHALHSPPQPQHEPMHAATSRTTSSSSGIGSSVDGAAGGSTQVGSWGSCAGLPAPGVEVRVVTEQEVQRLGLGGSSGADEAPSGGDGVEHGYVGGGEGALRVGEVWTRGPHTMLGYWRDPGETSKALLRGGWLRTGDLGYLDPQGQLWLLGRAKDMVKSGGENVFAPEVEGVLCRHPHVAAAAVVGVPDERLGEKVAAVVVLRPGTQWRGHTMPALPAPEAGSAPISSPGDSLSPEALQGWCRSQGLAGFKLPRLLAAQWQALPTNASGKVLKHVIRGQLSQLGQGSHALHPQLQSKL